MANPDQPRRRFAPVPVETTFESVRKAPPPQPRLGPGPNPELTPEPSPRSASPTIPERQQRRRFHPQLIETSRRARRAGDPAPATRPTDKTDITPYTNHIYLAKPRPRRKRGDSILDGEATRHMPPTRRETEDEGVKEYLLELAAKETARQFEEAALAAFPNSRAREGGVAHFYFRESSDSDTSAEEAVQVQDRGQPRVRRKSSNLGLNWWHRHMQQHVEHLLHARGDDAMAVDDDDTIMRTDSDLDKMDLPMPPNPLWTTTDKVASRHGRDSMVELRSRPGRSVTNDTRHTSQTESRPDHILPDAPEPEVTGAPASSSFLSAPDPRPRNGDAGFGRPFGAFGLQPEDPKLHLMRQAASPPMLGKDLTFRRCPSPKQTKLETDHPFVERGASREEKNRDDSGQGGLWRGYCYRSGSNCEYIVPADLHAADMIVTPHPPGSPLDTLTLDSLSDEPSPVCAFPDLPDSPPGLWSAQRRPRNGKAKGLHMLHGLDQRLRREKAQAERDEKILQEFDDNFVTQVYNYLSLGYPSMARSFDEELSKVSRVSVDELGMDDEKQMAKGHMLEMKLDDTPEHARCPRWKALKIYIVEWARQHPDLDNLNPLAWGMRERRGSWAI